MSKPPPIIIMALVCFACSGINAAMLAVPSLRIKPLNIFATIYCFAVGLVLLSEAA